MGLGDGQGPITGLVSPVQCVDFPPTLIRGRPIGSYMRT